MDINFIITGYNLLRSTNDKITGYSQVMYGGNNGIVFYNNINAKVIDKFIDTLIKMYADDYDIQYFKMSNILTWHMR
jgi:hypothetical protein